MVSCGQSEKDAVSTGSSQVLTGLSSSEDFEFVEPDDTGVQSPLQETLSGSHDAYYAIFNGLGTKVIHAEHISGVPTEISFINSEAKSMEVAIEFPETQSGTNLRLSQIVMPDGTMDGPFGMHVGYNLDQFGGYTLIFSENQMAGDRWSGNATITVTLRDTPYPESTVILP